MPVIGLLTLLLLITPPQAKRQHIPVPGGTYALQQNLFISKSFVSNQMWQNYRGYRGNDSTLLPDTTITYKGQPYYTNPAYANYPVIGLSAAQMQGLCEWLTVTTDKLKRSNQNTCAKKYWKKIRSFDPSDSLMMQVFIPDHSIERLLKNPYPNLSIGTYYSDTVLTSTTAGDFSKPAIAFCFAVRYIPR